MSASCVATMFERLTSGESRLKSWRSRALRAEDQFWNRPVTKVTGNDRAPSGRIHSPAIPHLGGAFL